MDLDYHFSRRKTPKGMSYPLKRSQLDAALIEAQLSRLTCVYYSLRQSGYVVLRGDFLGEGVRGHWAGAGYHSITVYAVPSKDRRAVESAIESDLLPKLIHWLRDLENGGNARRASSRLFVAAWCEGVATIDAD